MKWVLLLCILPLLLSGCSEEKPIPLKAVEWIHVDGGNFYGEDDRYFYTPESLKKLLLSLRYSGKTMNPKQDPDTLESPVFCITMAYCNGQRDRMYVKGDRFLRGDSGAWRQVDPEKLAPLHYLLHFQPGDPVA
jgi:hypothetical protein